MNKTSRHPAHGTDTRQLRVSTSFGKTHKPGSSTGRKSANPSAGQKRAGIEYLPASIWHNVLYGLGSAGTILGLLLLPGAGYVNVMLGIAATSAGILFLLLLAGVFQDFLPLGRQQEKRR